MNEQENRTNELTDEELMEMTGGSSFVDVVRGGIGRIMPLYGIIAFYGILPKPLN